MNQTKFKLEDNVRLLNSRARKGKVKLFGKDRIGPYVEVVWEDGEVSQEDESKLELVNDQLDKEFETLQAEVDKKLQAAAALIREASDLTRVAGKDSLLDHDANYEPLFDTYSLEGAMRYAGWSTSSWHC